MCQVRIHISQINNFCIHIFNKRREVTRINVAILLNKPRFARQTSLSLLITQNIPHLYYVISELK